MTARAAAVLLVACAGACGGDDGGDGARVVVVEHYRVPCIGLGPQLCLVTLDADGGDRQLLYQGIEGFTPVWGVRYQLRVEVIDVDDPPADAPGKRHVLDEVLAQEPVTVDTGFTLGFPPDPGATADDGFLVGTPPAAITLVGGPRLTCVSDPVCQAIWDRAQTGAAFELDCYHGVPSGEAIVVGAVR